MDLLGADDPDPEPAQRLCAQVPHALQAFAAQTHTTSRTFGAGRGLPLDVGRLAFVQLSTRG